MTSNPDIRSWTGWSHICLLSKHYIMFIVYTYTLFLGSEVYSAVWTRSLFRRATCPCMISISYQLLLPLSSLTRRKQRSLCGNFVHDLQ
jgi:hypothetical protein